MRVVNHIRHHSVLQKSCRQKLLDVQIPILIIHFHLVNDHNSTFEAKIVLRRMVSWSRRSIVYWQCSWWSQSLLDILYVPWYCRFHCLHCIRQGIQNTMRSRLSARTVLGSLAKVQLFHYWLVVKIQENCLKMFYFQSLIDSSSDMSQKIRTKKALMVKEIQLMKILINYDI